MAAGDITLHGPFRIDDSGMVAAEVALEAAVAATDDVIACPSASTNTIWFLQIERA